MPRETDVTSPLSAATSEDVTDVTPVTPVKDDVDGSLADTETDDEKDDDVVAAAEGADEVIKGDMTGTGGKTRS